MIPFSSKLPLVTYEMYHIKDSQTLRHPNGRFLCMFEGSANLTIDNTSYTLKTGDVFFLFWNTSYTLAPDDSCHILYLCIHPALLTQAFLVTPKDLSPHYTDSTPAITKGLNNLIARITQSCFSHEGTPSYEQLSRLFELFHFLRESSAQIEKEAESKLDQKLSALRLYCGQNYTLPISLTDAAEELGYTPPYLANLLKKHLGTTFLDYLNGLRVEVAQTLLLFSQEPFPRVALLCGFSNVAALEKTCNKLNNLSLEEYRNQANVYTYPDIIGVPVTSLSLIRDYLFQYTSDSTPVAVSEENTTYETAQVISSNRSPLKNTWNFLINLGSAKDFEKPSFRNQLIHMQQKLHFKYGRCVELFSLVESYQEGEETFYDFSAVFRLIDFMYSIHLKPFFDIDVKPFKLYREPEDSSIHYTAYLGTERYDERLFNLLPHFIRECVARYGFDEFASWKFEIWRRYNANLSSLEPADEYCRRFDQIAHIFKSLVPHCCIGGPGFNGFLPNGDFADTLEAFQNNVYRPDFISAYCFPYRTVPKQDRKPGYKAYTSADYMGDKLKEWRQIITSYGFPQAPFYITEYSAHITVENYINDSSYPAAFLIHQNLKGYESVDALGYWLATDFSLIYGSPNAPFFGGNGILSKHGISKPAFYAHDFLNNLGDVVIAMGEHYIVTQSADRTIQILVYHLGSLRESFVESPTTRDLLFYPNFAFEDQKSLDLSLNLQKLVPGTYRQKSFHLSSHHGNILNAWKQLNYSINIGTEEIQYMAAQSLPQLSLSTIEIDSQHTFHFTLNPNEAQLVILQPVF